MTYVICHVPMAHTPQKELNVDPLEYWTSCSVQLKAFKQGDYCVDKRLNQIWTLCSGLACYMGGWRSTSSPSK